MITRAPDPYKQVIGTSPLAGDRGSNLIDIPSDATRDWRNRYYFMLQSETVGRGEELFLLGISQALRIGWTQTIEVEQQTPQGPINVSIDQRIDIPVRDPDFDFTDGDVSWHLRFVPGHTDEGNLGAAYDPNLIQEQYPSGSGLWGMALAPYVAPPEVPGEGIGSLGVWNDLRFLREYPTDSLRYHIVGPGRLVYFATVFQTDPTNRIPWSLPQNFDVSDLTDEQRLVVRNPNLVRYTRIGGRLLIDRRNRPARAGIARPDSAPDLPVSEEP